MNPSTIFTLLTQDGAHLLAISNVIGLQKIITVAPHLEAVVKSYTAGGIVTVLENNGPDVQAILEEIGVQNIGLLSTNAAAILKTVTAPAAA